MLLDDERESNNTPRIVDSTPPPRICDLAAALLDPANPGKLEIALADFVAKLGYRRLTDVELANIRAKFSKMEKKDCVGASWIDLPKTVHSIT